METTTVFDERKYTPRELAATHHLHESPIRRIFHDQPGVIRIGAAGSARSHLRLRIPESVARRVFAEMTVGSERI